MPSVLSYTNAFPGIPFPNHLSGQSKPQSFIYPGAVQPSKGSATTVLFTTNAFPGIPFPNHLSGQSHPQSFMYPGAVQPAIAAAPSTTIPIGFVGMPNAIRQFRVVIA